MPEEKKKTNEAPENEAKNTQFIEDYIEEIYNTNEAYGDYAHLETFDEKIARLKNLRKEVNRETKNLKQVSLKIQAIDKAIEMAKEQQAEEKIKTKESRKKFGIGFSGFFNKKTEADIKQIRENAIAEGKEELELHEVAKGNRWEREALRLEQEALEERTAHEKKLKELIAQLEKIEKDDPGLKNLVEKAKENLHKLENINTEHHELITRGQNSTHTNLLAEIKKLQSYVKGKIPDFTEDVTQETEKKHTGGPIYLDEEDEKNKTQQTRKKHYRATPPPIPPEIPTEEVNGFEGEINERTEKPQEESEIELLEEIDDEKLFDNDYYKQFLTQDYIVFPTTDEEKEELRSAIKRLEKEGKSNRVQKIVALTSKKHDPEMNEIWIQAGAGKYLTKEILQENAKQWEESKNDEISVDDLLRLYINYEGLLEETNSTIRLPHSNKSRIALRNLIKEYTEGKDTDDISVENYDKLVHAIARGYDASQKSDWIALGAGEIVKRIEERGLIPEKELSEQEKIENIYYQKFFSGEPIILPISPIEKKALTNIIDILEKEGNTAVIERMVDSTYDGTDTAYKQMWVDVGAGKYLQNTYEKILFADTKKWEEGKKETKEREVEEKKVNEAMDLVRHKRNIKEIIQSTTRALTLPYSKPGTTALKETIADYEKNKGKDNASKNNYDRLVLAIARGYDKSQKNRWIEFGAGEIIEQIEQNNLPEIAEDIPEISIDDFAEIPKREVSNPPPIPEIAETEADIKERKKRAIEFLRDQPFEIPEFKNIQTNEQDYDKSPELRERLFAAKKIVIGDLHASAKKLIEGCIASGLIEFPSTEEQKKFSSDYDTLIEKKGKRDMDKTGEVYKLQKEADEQFTLEFMDTLKKIRWVKPDRKLVLIGDTILDRGYSDSVMVRLVNHLRGQGAEITTIASNHDLDFFYGQIGLNQRSSGFDDMNPLSKDEYKEYLKQTQLFDYDPEEKIFYAHAYQTQQILNRIGQKIGTPATPDNIETFVKKANVWYAQQIEVLNDNGSLEKDDKELLMTVIWGKGYRNPGSRFTDPVLLENIKLYPAFDNKISIMCGHDNDLEDIQETKQNEILNAFSLNDTHLKNETRGIDKNPFRIFAS